MQKGATKKREYTAYDASGPVKKRRAMRNKARRAMLRAGKVHKGDGLDVDHTVPLTKGGGVNPGNLRVVPAGQNRSFARKGHALKSQTSKRERKGKK